MSGPSAIVVQSLSFAYPGERPALSDVSFRVAEGERVALFGANGAGKTTLLHCLTGIVTVSAGMVTVAGLDPARPGDRRNLPSVVGLVFQNADDQIVMPFVAEDVAFGPINFGFPADEVTRRVDEAMRAAGVSELADRSTLRLSVGEKRRVALAGALAAGQRILLLDEPTAGLDPRSRRRLAETLESWSGTILMATHNADFAARLCSRAVILGSGQVLADAPLADVLKDPQLIERAGL